MHARSRAAVLAVLCAAGFALPATGARAAECDRVVVDYGTFGDAPSTVANTTCVTVADGSNAAQALQARADKRHAPAPRYQGDFLCAIDGYPDSGCGLDASKPYWSLWYYANAKWVYSSVGMRDLLVADRDHDGHPDPLGFRYLDANAAKTPPRANPAYPKPTPTPRPSRAATPSATPRPTTAAPGPATTSGPPATTATATSATAAPSGAATRSRTPGATVTGTAGPSATDDPLPDIVLRGTRTGGFPVGAVAGGLVALGLLGAGAWRFRRTP